MIEYQDEAQRKALIETLHEGYMEIFPTSTIEERLVVLEPDSYVAVTCSPTKGVGETLDMTERLANRGFKVVPHLAAKSVRNRAHLKEIMARLDDLPVDSIFVPGGDAAKPIGDYANSFELLGDIAEFDHKFRLIGVAAHPEGHPAVDDESLLKELEKKQPLATYLVTQMCFDTELLGAWLHRIRERGITLPAWIGIPGVADRASLLKTSLRIGVGDSLRFLRRKSDVVARLMGTRTYTPNKMLGGLAPYLVDPECRIAGYHIFCFNQVERTETWRHEALETLIQDPKHV